MHNKVELWCAKRCRGDTERDTMILIRQNAVEFGSSNIQKLYEYGKAEHLIVRLSLDFES